MFRNEISYKGYVLCTFTSPHVPKIGEHIHINNTTYEITHIVYFLNETINGTTTVSIIVNPI